MNLFSWSFTISWISIFLLTQSLLKAAFAAAPPSELSVFRQSEPPGRTSSTAAHSRIPRLARSAPPNELLVGSVLSTPLSPPLLAETASISVFPPSDPSLLVNPIAPSGNLLALSQPTFDLLPTAPAAPNYSNRGTPSYRLLQLVTHLSRWTRGISEALRLTVPLVSVVQINPPPIDVDRWNVLSLTDPGIQPVEIADLPRQSCMSEEAEAFPAGLGSLFQVQVRGQAIAEFPRPEQAEQFADRLRQVMQMDNFDPQMLKPVLLDNTPGGKAGEVPLFWIEPELALQLDRSAELLAITWINNLRAALNVPTLSLIESQKQMHDLVATSDRIEGTASWYGPYFHGRITATGETFDQGELTAAHPTLPFDTYLKVTNLETGKAVIVRINDRGPYFEDRSLDLSREAARCLNSEISGVVPYEAVIMKRSSGIYDLVPPEETAAEPPAELSSDAPTENPAAIDSPQMAIDPADAESLNSGQSNAVPSSQAEDTEL